MWSSLAVLLIAALLTAGAAFWVLRAYRRAGGGADSARPALAACAAVGRRLCTGAEWDLACPCAPSLTEMFNDNGGSGLDWEWVAEETGGVAHKRGYASCSDQSTHVVTDPYDFRCCVDR